MDSILEVSLRRVIYSLHFLFRVEGLGQGTRVLMLGDEGEGLKLSLVLIFQFKIFQGIFNHLSRRSHLLLFVNISRGAELRIQEFLTLHFMLRLRLVIQRGFVGVVRSHWILLNFISNARYFVRGNR